LNILALIPLITSCFYILLLVLALQQSGKRLGKYFIFYLAVAAFWSFTSFMLHLDAPPEQTMFWNEVLVVVLVWAMLAYYQFTLAYTDKPLGWPLFAGYAVLVLLAVLSFSGHVVEYSYVVNGVFYHGLGIMVYAIGAVGFTFTTMVIIQLARKYRRSSDPIDRNRTMYLIFGWVIVVLFTYTNLIPAVAGLPLDHMGSLLNAMIITYAISQFRLLDIKMVARTFLSYFATTIIIGGTCAGAILLVFHYFSGQPPVGFMLIGVIIVLLLVAVARPLRNRIQKLVDRIFYPQTYQYRQALLGFSAKMSHILNLKELADEMLPTLCKALDISWSGLMLQDSENGDFGIRFVHPQVESKTVQEFSISADSLIVSWLDKNGMPLDPGQIDNITEFHGLWQTEREQITRSGLGLLYPMKSRDHIICILALGQKRNSKLYSHEDIHMVSSMANQAGIIIENAQLYTQATTRANTDELTSLYNHRHFHERLEQEIARGSRFGSTFSLILMDIDLFKSYNDIYGHLAGDQVLRKVGRYIATSVRSIDLAFRYGGEEFAVILPEARLDDAYKGAERIRKTIESKSSSRAMPITVSVGVANWPTDGVMKEEIINRADAALYRAKELGRNRTCLTTDLNKSGANLIGTELEAQPKALSIIYALAATVDAKDSYTYGHSRKVSEYAVRMAEALGLSLDKINTLRAAGLLHDIGKVGVPDSILTKKSALTGEEWNPIRMHPELGVEILKHVIDLVNCLPAINYHHEHYDGSGYPGGIKEKNIPIEARILSIADAYDAMTSPRPYRSQLSLEEALLELERCASTQFDPELVKIFCDMMRPFLAQNLESGKSPDLDANP
jgi:diguanylate cyclase (GGDEF)-like protein/putative nucleotidyltransferase with HDIG domain